MAFEHKLPKFQPERVLTRAMLDSLRDLSYLEQRSRFDGYSDGIVVGCDLAEEKIGETNYLYVLEGMIKYDSRLYTLAQPVQLSYEHTNEWAILKVTFSPARETRDFDYYTGEVTLDKTATLRENDLELCRFKLREGSRLRTAYVSFEDMNTEYDTVNLTHVKQSAKGGFTLSPKITSAFAREAFPFIKENALDAAFCAACLRDDTPPRREYLQRYLCTRMGLEYEEMDNRTIHTHLSNLLRSIKSGRPADKKARPKRGPVFVE